MSERFAIAFIQDEETSEWSVHDSGDSFVLFCKYHTCSLPGPMMLVNFNSTTGVPVSWQQRGR